MPIAKVLKVLTDLNSFVANLASILTAVVASSAAAYYWIDGRSKRIRLEQYLKQKKETKSPEYIHSVIHLMAKLGMTEAEILHASFSSRHIVRRTKDDPETNLATQLLFEYSNDPKAK
jgi:hypothetical protein